MSGKVQANDQAQQNNSKDNSQATSPDYSQGDTDNKDNAQTNTKGNAPDTSQGKSIDNAQLSDNTAEALAAGYTKKVIQRTLGHRDDPIIANVFRY